MPGPTSASLIGKMINIVFSESLIHREFTARTTYPHSPSHDPPQIHHHKSLPSTQSIYIEIYYSYNLSEKEDYIKCKIKLENKVVY
jgi:hypothetical protein